MFSKPPRQRRFFRVIMLLSGDALPFDWWLMARQNGVAGKKAWPRFGLCSKHRSTILRQLSTTFCTAGARDASRPSAACVASWLASLLACFSRRLRGLHYKPPGSLTFRSATVHAAKASSRLTDRVDVCSRCLMGDSTCGVRFGARDRETPLPLPFRPYVGPRALRHVAATGQRFERPVASDTT